MRRPPLRRGRRLALARAGPLAPRPRACSARRCLRARLTSRRISKRIRLRVSGASARRTPWAREAACTTVSRSTRSAKSAGRRAPPRRRARGPGRASPEPGDRRTRRGTTVAVGVRAPRATPCGEPRRPRLDGRASARTARPRGAPGGRTAARSTRDHEGQHHATRHAATDGDRRHGAADASPGPSDATASLARYRPRMIRRTRSQRSLTAASAPSAVGW